jgi:hypothetical protein
MKILDFVIIVQHSASLVWEQEKINVQPVMKIIIWKLVSVFSSVLQINMGRILIEPALLVMNRVKRVLALRILIAYNVMKTFYWMN